jgi:fructokinase
MAQPTYTWGFDLGGTKIEGVVLHPVTNAVLSRQRVPTEAAKGYEHVIGQMVKLKDQLASAVGQSPTRLGIGTPGSLDPHSRCLKNSNTTILNGQPLQRDLELALGIPIKIANDANCFALAEAVMGVVPDELPNFESIFGVIMGTGVGGGVVVRGHDGRPLVLGGRQGIAGEWGHNELEPGGTPCYCGRVGCVETVISGTGLQNYYQSLAGVRESLSQITAWHQQGRDSKATATMRRLIEMFGKAIAVIINILDPDAIILGGGVGNIDLLHTEGVAEVRKYVFNDRMETRFLRPKLGDSAGVFGAAMLVA